MSLDEAMVRASLSRLLERTKENERKINQIWWFIIVILLSNGAENVETLTNAVDFSSSGSKASDVINVKE